MKFVDLAVEEKELEAEEQTEITISEFKPAERFSFDRDAAIAHFNEKL